MGEPGGLPSVGSHRVGHDWSHLAAAATVTSNVHVLQLLNISGFYGILFFTALGFISITRHIHNWELFSLWLHLFILSGVIPMHESEK